MKFVLALDQGTTSSRAIVFDELGQPVAQAQREHRQLYPRPGWVEHDPIEIWENQSAVALEAMARAGLRADQIAAIGITNQRETTVVWERKSGKPIGNAIVWQDRRTTDSCAQLKNRGLEADWSRRSGLRLDPYFSGTKLHWILQHVEGARAAAQRGELCFGTVESWLIYRLSAGKTHVSDVSNASRTLLFDIHRLQWDPQALKELDIPASMLPKIVPNSGVVAEAAEPAALRGIPIAGLAGDQQAALFGQACFEPGMAKNTYGTGCFMLMNTGDKAVPSTNNLLTTVAWQIGDQTTYALEGSVFIAGAVIQWLRDELKIIDSATQCDELAASVPDSGGTILVPAFAGLGAPHWDPNARGSIFGLTRGSNRAQLCRAALESIALQSAELIACMERDSGISLSELRVDGGASRSAILMQIQANLLERAVIRPRCIETTALGAAYLAGLGVGLWKDRSEISNQWSLDARFVADSHQEASQALKTLWQRAVQRSKDWQEA